MITQATIDTILTDQNLMLDDASVKLSRVWQNARQSHIDMVISAKLADLLGEISQAHHNAH